MKSRRLMDQPQAGAIIAYHSGEAGKPCCASQQIRPLMAALPPKADIGTQPCNVRFVPKADITTLFDHLVGNGEQVSWHLYAKRSRGLQVDDQ